MLLSPLMPPCGAPCCCHTARFLTVPHLPPLPRCASIVCGDRDVQQTLQRLSQTVNFQARQGAGRRAFVRKLRGAPSRRACLQPPCPTLALASHRPPVPLSLPAGLQHTCCPPPASPGPGPACTQDLMRMMTGRGLPDPPPVRWGALAARSGRRGGTWGTQGAHSAVAAACSCEAVPLLRLCPGQDRAAPSAATSRDSRHSARRPCDPLNRGWPSFTRGRAAAA